jgi:hypothetical protein
MGALSITPEVAHFEIDRHVQTVVGRWRSLRLPLDSVDRWMGPVRGQGILKLICEPRSVSSAAPKKGQLGSLTAR